MTYSNLYLDEVIKIAQTLDIEKIENLATLLSDTRAREGRLFICGVGGSAGNASHAVNDFRKIVEIEAFCPSDNVSELTPERMTRVLTKSILGGWNLQGMSQRH